jgi:hypothetical protein
VSRLRVLLHELADVLAEHLERPVVGPAAPGADDRVGYAEAARLGLGRKAFRRACRTGALQAELAGKAYLVRRGDLEAFCAARRVAPCAASEPPPEQGVRARVREQLQAGRLRVVRPGGVR